MYIIPTLAHRVIDYALVKGPLHLNSLTLPEGSRYK